MAAPSSVAPPQPNRRKRVRHKIQTPAYATFTGESKSSIDLHEILNISEGGVAIQCDVPLEVGRRINLCLDLAECPDHIYTTGQVIWSNASGRSGLRFAELPPISMFRLREWLFLNAVAAVANADEAGFSMALHAEQSSPRPSYTDTLAGVAAVQREVEALGPDLGASLQLVATRVQALIHASGAAIALADRDPAFMVCRASSGPDAPPVGARLQIGSGFSGECVRTGRLLRCDDSETDARVDAESCRALGIRSMVAVPVRVGDRPIAILEAFSAEPRAFNDCADSVMQRLSDTVLAAFNRAARAEGLAAAPAPTEGNVLFASSPAREKKKLAELRDAAAAAAFSLPRSHLILLISALAAIAMALGYHSAPLIQGTLGEPGRGELQSVLASSGEPKAWGSSPSLIPTASLEQLRQWADRGNAAAQNALGLRYASGDGVAANAHEALTWFTRAAEQGYIPAQSKLGSAYYRGRGIPQNLSQAYFWMALARANGDENSKVLAPLVAAQLTRDQVTAIELDANRWLQQHRASTQRAGGR